MLKLLIFILMTQSLLQDCPHLRRVENLALFSMVELRVQSGIWIWFGTDLEVGVLLLSLRSILNVACDPLSLLSCLQF